MAVRYKILEELGTGGAGTVFKAYDTQLDRYVAIKRLLTREQAESGDTQAGSLKKEAASLATLQHPNVVSVYDVGSDDLGFFMVMELVEGENLSDWVKTVPMPLEDFHELATQSLEALLTAHNLSILHRDLKPENIKVKRLPGGRLQVKVLDFGLARLSYGAKKMTEDQSGNVVGSIYYMAPEQLLRRPVDVRTDLYSLGCVFYQALSCRRPFDDSTVRGVVQAHVEHMVYPLHMVAPALPQPVSDWVMWLINADPAHRPANAQTALDSLRTLAAVGCFKPKVESAPVALAMPEAPRPATGAVAPRTPASPRPAQGSTSKRIGTVGAARPPTGAVPRRPTGAVPPRMMPGMAPVAAPPQTGVKRSGLPVWVWLAVTMVLLAVAWRFWPDKKETPVTGTASTSSAPAAPIAPKPPTRPADFLAAGAYLHYRAGEKMDAWTDPGKPPVPAKGNDLILTWNDLAGTGGNVPLIAYDKLKDNCPKLIHEKPSALRQTVAMARFETGDAMFHFMDPADARAKEYPFGDTAKSKGVTLVMLVRPRITDKEVRCFRLRNRDGRGTIHVRAYPNSEWRLMCRVGNTTKEAKITGRSTKQFSVVGMTWNTVSNKMLLSVRGEDGGKARIEADAPKDDRGVLNELRLADFTTDTSNPVAPEDKFAGDIVEFAAWPFAMEWEARSGQEWKFMQFYFNNTGSRY